MEELQRELELQRARIEELERQQAFKAAMAKLQSSLKDECDLAFAEPPPEYAHGKQLSPLQEGWRRLGICSAPQAYRTICRAFKHACG